MTPELSVIIPVYNEASIVESAGSELAQGLDERKLDYEIIFAENGSRDSTPQILQAMCEKNPRMRWFHSETPNYGAALKRGINEARGELVVCDEIDLCDLLFYDRSLPMLKNRSVDMVVGTRPRRVPPTSGRWFAGWRPGCTTGCSRWRSIFRGPTPMG